MKSKLLILVFILLSMAFLSVSFVSAETNEGLVLYPTEATGSACIGSEVVYDFRVTNTTAVSVTVSFDYTSIWPYEGPSFQLTIPAGGHYDFQVSVYIPWTTNPGDHDTLTLYVSGGGWYASSTVITTANIINNWVDLSDTPRGARWSSVVYHDGYLYKIGGENAGAQSWLDIYDVAEDTWSPGANMPGPRYWLDCEAIGGYIYCGGGLSTQRESTLYIYDISQNSWSTGEPLPYAVYSYASAVLDGKYYIIGGSLANNVYSDAVLVYDPGLTQWDTTRTSMSTTRRMHAAGAIDGKIVVAGGYNGSFLDSAEMYDPDANSWTAVTSMPLPWVNAADGVNNDRYLILAGGSSTSLVSSSNEAYIYDADADAWQQLPDMDRAIYGAEGDSDGTNFWLASGQIYTDTWTASPFTTLMDACPVTCPSPVTGADFTWDPPGSPWTGFSVEFTATTISGSPTIEYAWDFGDSNTGYGSIIDHTFIAPLTYTVSLTASNCDGASTSTASHDISVLDPPTIDADPIGMDALQLTNTITTQQLELCNDGDADLDWIISEDVLLPVKGEMIDQEKNMTADLPWLSESATSGTILGDNCTIIDITFDSTGLEEDIYLGKLSITSNDPYNAVIDVPVSLTVTHPAIELVKTISLIENTCGSTNSLTVYANTTVYYCYTVTNTGGILFDTHNLTDDQLGILLDAEEFMIAPGSSISIISNGVLITESVTNEALWTAEYGVFNASDSAIATVTVLPSPDVKIYLPSILKVPAR